MATIAGAIQGEEQDGGADAHTLRVRAANHASATIASGDGLGDATWPPTQSDSIGNDSRYSTSLAGPPDITPNDSRSGVGTMRVTLSLRDDELRRTRDP